MYKTFIFFISLIIFNASICRSIFAAQVSFQSTKTEKLTNYLKKQNSPLISYAPVFVKQAEKYDLDYRLVAAISGVESSFGKSIPKNSYNAYGWANGKYYFQSWEDGIITVTKVLALKYKMKWGADTPYKIGRYYATSPTWADRVVFVMNQIEDTTPTFSQIALSL